MCGATLVSGMLSGYVIERLTFSTESWQYTTATASPACVHPYMLHGN
jgi:hypothetical protein